MAKVLFKQWGPFAVLLIIAILALFIPLLPNFDEGKYNAADVAFVLVAAALVFLMTPGLAFFYGGMVHRKNVLSTMIKSVVAAGVITVLWVVVGFSLAFGDSIGGFIGNPSTYLFFQGVNSGPAWGTIPLSLFAVFQLMFAIITPGLVVGAVAERIRFTSYILFIVMFALFVYSPLAHWTWHPEGMLFKMGVLDFAGGTVVHISAGMAALAGALVLKRRKSHLEHKEVPPANIPYVLIGTGLLWFGWFGFNAGSALGANALAVSAFLTTNIAAGAAGLSWMFFDVSRGKKPSVLGFCIGAVVGLVAITPGAGFVSIPSSIFIGVIAAVISNLVVSWKQKTSLDDTLDVFPCHGVGGIVGMLLTGVFATKTVNPAGVDGLLYGNVEFFFTQLKGAVIVIIFSFVMSFIIFKLINLVQPIRVTSEEEEEGLDASQHNEKYTQGTLIVAGQEVENTF
ncbi:MULTISPECIES: ammonium transporter [Pedobacter]|uniref:Ammonium transporter n=1 Tax=Pedobacter heparinus (strain ATCC 13125 / DSM 2366 / CIP 104194 / JCM 7457 / NBRC 12017 / NCIMB 9290 / NRRL B-14731 / HIM 762-3) TaxID=485917 RepID=C6Y314_PEDHD|nr:MULTISPECIES: ammonium transporter [Pedobacter]ACU03227.1 ammonium transporter [Pedobacter heparinus DSM 2366]MBB5440996.1 Amt family ammonium transporter [Pedobacter sp. AK017]